MSPPPHAERSGSSLPPEEEAGSPSGVPAPLFHIHATTAHFPVALIPAALVFYVLDEAGYHEGFAFCSKTCFGAAVVAVPFTVLTGYLSWRLGRRRTSSGIFQTKLLAAGLLAAAGVATIGPELRQEDLRASYAVGLVICLILVFFLAHLGGLIVHGRIGLGPVKRAEETKEEARKGPEESCDRRTSQG